MSIEGAETTPTSSMKTPILTNAIYTRGPQPPGRGPLLDCSSFGTGLHKQWELVYVPATHTQSLTLSPHPAGLPNQKA